MEAEDPAETLKPDATRGCRQLGLSAWPLFSWLQQGSSKSLSRDPGSVATRRLTAAFFTAVVEPMVASSVVRTVFLKASNCPASAEAPWVRVAVT